MKFFTIITAAALLAGSAFGQVTNLVKVSALPSAGVVDGSELVPIVQNSTTKAATILQLTALASAQTTAASNYFARVTGTNAATAAAAASSITAGSNSLALKIDTASNYLASFTSASSNTWLAAIGGTNAALAANVAAASNAITAALVATNAALAASIASVAAGQTGSLTNGAQVTFGRVTIPTFNIPPITVGGSASITTNIDFNAGGQQTVNVALGNIASFILFKPVNFKDGDNVWLAVNCTNGIAGNAGSATSVSGGIIDTWGTAANAQLSGAVKSAMLNWQVFGTRIDFSMTVHP